jgi:hypothetical protein
MLLSSPDFGVPRPRLIPGSSRFFQALLQGSIACIGPLQWTRLASPGCHGVQMPCSPATYESALRTLLRNFKPQVPEYRTSAIAVKMNNLYPSPLPDGQQPQILFRIEHSNNSSFRKNNKSQHGVKGLRNSTNLGSL